MVFVDECGIYLKARTHTTWAPKGQTPTIEIRTSRKKLNVIGAATSNGKLYNLTFEHSIKQPQVVRFLRHLLDWIGKPLIVVWDGASWHNQSNEVEAFLETPYGQRILHIETLPTYSPQLNPQELVWNTLKTSKLSAHTCTTIKQLKLFLRKQLRNIKRTIDPRALIQHLKNKWQNSRNP